LQLKFRDRAYHSFQEAIKEQESSMAHGSIPKFFVLLLFILGFNELQWTLSFMFSSPITFMFFALIFAVCYIIYALHLWPILFPVINPFITMFKENFLDRIEKTLNTGFDMIRGRKKEHSD